MLLVFVVVLIFLQGCTSQSITGQSYVESSNVKIGFIAPLTGPFAEWGKSIQRGLEIASEDTNHKFIIDYQDSFCDPKTTVNIAKKFFEVNGIKIIIGPGCVTGMRAIAPIAEQNNVLLFSTGLLDNSIFEEFDNIINFATQISAETKYLADFLQTQNISKIAVIHGNNYFGEEYGRVFPNQLQKREINVTLVESTDLNINDFRTVIIKLAETSPEAVFIHQSEKQIGLFARQLREQGYNIPIYSYYGAEAQSVISAGQLATEGIMYSYPFNNVDETKKSLRLNRDINLNLVVKNRLQHPFLFMMVC